MMFFFKHEYTNKKKLCALHMHSVRRVYYSVLFAPQRCSELFVCSKFVAACKSRIYHVYSVCGGHYLYIELYPNNSCKYFCAATQHTTRHASITRADPRQSINLKILKEPHTSTSTIAIREATSQHHHTGGKPCVAKRRRLGGLRAKRSSVSLRDSLNSCVARFFRSARNCRGKPPQAASGVSSS